MKLVLRLEPYSGDDSSLETAFWEPGNEASELNPEFGSPMWVILKVEGDKAEIIDYGYRTEADARAAL